MALKCPKCGGKNIGNSINGSKCIDCNFEWKRKKQQLGCLSSIFVLFVGLIFVSKILSLVYDDSDKAPQSSNVSSQNNEKKESNYIVYSKTNKSYILYAKSSTWLDSLFFKCEVDKNKFYVMFFHGKTLRYSYPLKVELHGTNTIVEHKLDDKNIVLNSQGALLQYPNKFLEDLYNSSKESNKDMSVHFSELSKSEKPSPYNGWASFDLTGFEQIYNELKDCK